MNLLKYPNPKLYLKSETVIDFTPDLIPLCEEMKKYCQELHGYALAAPQIDIQKRFFVLAPSIKPELQKYDQAFFNPVIENPRDIIMFPESCLSIPDVSCLNKRFSKFTLKYQTITGDQKEVEADGLFAIICQHEIDHLDGLLFISRLSDFDRRKVQNRINKLRT